MYSFWPTKFLTLLLLAFFVHTVNAQVRFINNQGIKDLTTETVGYIYGYQFSKAKLLIAEIEKKAADHPLVPLLKALFLYQRDYPMMTSTPSAPEFVKMCSLAITQSEAMLKLNENDTEGTAFDMVARALLSMYYVDNGESMAVARGASSLYHQISKGFKMLDQLNEFYFTTGLYNYYRIAYPQVHPIYKPIAALFPDGNKPLGLQQLKYAADNCIFLKAEALLFITLIYNNYENSPLMAVVYSQKLHNMYPQNLYYIAEYCKTLLINQQYESAREQAEILLNDPGHKFAYMRGLIYMGVIYDHQDKNLDAAKKNFEAGLKMAPDFGRYGEPLLTMANFGLSRIYRNMGNQKKADVYYKAGKSTLIYNYEYQFVR